MTSQKQSGRFAKTTVLLCLLGVVSASKTDLSEERIVFQTDFGELELALYPQAAPKTVAHILDLAKMGAYNTNHFFRVDKGFVAQTADITSGRSTPPNKQQKELDEQRVPLEVHEDLKHTKRGLLSMARSNDPNSGGSSFSIMLNPAPHLDMQYTIFGEVTKGIETLAKFEEVETFKQGIFVMPKERVQIHSTHVWTPRLASLSSSSHDSRCFQELMELQHRFDAQSKRVEELRRTRLP